VLEQQSTDPWPTLRPPRGPQGLQGLRSLNSPTPLPGPRRLNPHLKPSPEALNGQPETVIQSPPLWMGFSHLPRGVLPPTPWGSPTYPGRHPACFSAWDGS
jgi:hypothetical protein